MLEDLGADGKPVYAFQVLNLSKEDIVVLASDLDREVSLNEGLFEL